MQKENIDSINLIGHLHDYDIGIMMPVTIKSLVSNKVKPGDDITPTNKYLPGIKFDIVVYDEDLCEEEIVGEITGKYYDVDNAEYDDMIAPAFDNVDQYTWDIYETIAYNKNLRLKHCHTKNIFSIDTFIINPNYRNLNIGTSALMLLKDALKIQFNRDIAVIIAECCPIEYSKFEISELEWKHREKKLERFFTRLGFIKIDRYMIFDTSNDMQEIYNNNL